MSTKEITQRNDATASSSMSDADHPGFTARLEGDAILACAGELELTTNPALRVSLNRVLCLAPDRVVVDLSQVSFFDAGAVGELVQAHTTSRAAGSDLVVRAPSPFVRRVLDIVGLTSLIAHDPEQATASVELAGQFTAGSRSSVVIDEAKGLLAEYFDIGIGEASIMLRAFSTARSQSMEDAAVALMARKIDVAQVPHPPGPSTRPRDGTDQGADNSSASERS